MLAQPAIFGNIDRDANILRVNHLKFFNGDARVVQQKFLGILQAGAGKRQHMLVPALNAGR